MHHNHCLWAILYVLPENRSQVGDYTRLAKSSLIFGGKINCFRNDSEAIRIKESPQLPCIISSILMLNSLGGIKTLHRVANIVNKLLRANILARLKDIKRENCF